MGIRTTERSLRGTLRGIDTCIAWSQDPQCCDTAAESVSRWSVLEQLEHLALADESILPFIVPADSAGRPAVSGDRPRLLGYLVLWTGYIPRGKGKAPEFVIPRQSSREDVHSRFQDLRERYAKLRDSLSAVAHATTTQPHPALGHFTPARWLRFVDVHHRHHEKIIRDMLAVGRSGGR